MLLKYNKYRVLRLFFINPTSDFQLRQISRLSRIAPPSTKRYLKELQGEGLISTSKKGNYPIYRAARDFPLFRNLKKWSLAIELTTSGLPDYIAKQCSPDAIILFGSASRGEDIESSDIDIAIVAAEVPLDLKKYEKQINRKISPLFVKFSSLSNELRNNILNGVIVYGYVKVF